MHRLNGKTVLDASDDDVYDPENAELEIYQRVKLELCEEFGRTLAAIFAHIGGRLLKPKTNMHDVLVDFWVAAYATGSWVCDGVPMVDRAHQIGVSKATLSAAAVKLCLGNGWPPSEYMRDPDTMRAYMEARTAAIKKENAKHEEKAA